MVETINAHSELIVVIVCFAVMAAGCYLWTRALNNPVRGNPRAMQKFSGGGGGKRKQGKGKPKKSKSNQHYSPPKKQRRDEDTLTDEEIMRMFNKGF